MIENNEDRYLYVCMYIFIVPLEVNLWTKITNNVFSLPFTFNADALTN